MSWVMVLITACWTSIALAAVETASTGAEGAFEPTSNIACRSLKAGCSNTHHYHPQRCDGDLKEKQQNNPGYHLATVM